MTDDKSAPDGAEKPTLAPSDDRAPHQREPLWRILFVSWIYGIIRATTGRHARKLNEADVFSLGRATDARNLSETWLAEYRREDADFAAYEAGVADRSLAPSWRDRVRAPLLQAIGLRKSGLMRFLVSRFGARLVFRCALPLSVGLGLNLATSLLVKVRLSHR